MVCGRAIASKTWPRRRHGGATQKRSGASTRCGDVPCWTWSPTLPIMRWFGLSVRDQRCCSSPRTSMTCTSGRARPPCCPCTASCACFGAREVDETRSACRRRTSTRSPSWTARVAPPLPACGQTSCGSVKFPWEWIEFMRPLTPFSTVTCASWWAPPGTCIPPLASLLQHEASGRPRSWSTSILP